MHKEIKFIDYFVCIGLQVTTRNSTFLSHMLQARIVYDCWWNIELFFQKKLLLLERASGEFCEQFQF